jgi:predicted nucleic acid-binding protein
MGRARIRLCSSKSAAGSAEKPSSIGARRFPGKLRLIAPLKIVLDTNVVLDWFVFRNPGVAAVADAVQQGHVQWIASPDTRHVLEHARLVNQPFTAERVLTSAAGLMKLTVMPESLPLTRWRCSDPSDQKFIDLAVTARARWLLTRDRAVLKLARKAAPSGLLIQVPERWRLNPATSAPG